MTTKIAISQKTPGAYQQNRLQEIFRQIETQWNGGSANLEFLQSGTGATARNLQAWGRDRAVLLTDFLPTGYVTDGSVDYTTQIQAWLNKGGKLIAPVGTWLCGAVTPISNSEIEGYGIGSTIFKVANSTNSSLFTLAALSSVAFRDFKISGNSANQTSGSGIHVSGASTDIVCSNVLVDDHYDYGFYFEQGTNIRLFNCGATNGKAGASSSAVRGGFLFGTTSGPTTVNNVECFGCYASGSNSFVDGFMSENGTDHRFVGCRTAVAYTGFKVKGSNVIVTGCYATGGVQGYQTQTSSHNLIFQGNIAYRCNDSGFFLGNIDTVNNLIGLCLFGNLAIENGQSPSSTSYGFAFECTASCTMDQIVLNDNIAIDNQLVKTQTHGISFGGSGTVSNVTMNGNFCKGNTIDIYTGGASLQTSTFTYGWNIGYDGSSLLSVWPRSVERLNFWIDNLATGAGTTVLSDGLGARGYMVPRAGYIRSLSVRGNATTTAGQATFQLRVNGTINSNFNCHINTTNPTFDIQTQAWLLSANALAAGDMITVICASDGSFAPGGTTDFDAVVEIAY